LLPNAAIAELVGYTPPGSMACDEPWVEGCIQWRGWQVPLFSFARMAQLADEERQATARIAVLKALNGSTNMSFLAMVTQGFPQLVSVSKQNLNVVPGAEMTPGVAYQIEIDGQTGYIPDLAHVEKTLSRCLAEARKSA